MVLQQYLYGVGFFGLLGLFLGCVREFRNLNSVTRTTSLTSEERRKVIASGAKTFGSMWLWWTAMYAVVILVANFR